MAAQPTSHKYPLEFLVRSISLVQLVQKAAVCLLTGLGCWITLHLLGLLVMWEVGFKLALLLL